MQTTATDTKTPQLDHAPLDSPAMPAAGTN
jgi:hypothetical protein